MSADQDRIGPYQFIRYEDPTDAFQAYDPRFSVVAVEIATWIERRIPGATVEHVGSSAIPGCDGKGVVDLMAPYGPGCFSATFAAIVALGFQEFVGRAPFPAGRAVFVGAWTHGDESFRVHLHVIPADSPEIETQRRFRDALRADPALVKEYVAIKASVLASGVADSTAYNDGKDAFIKRVIGGPGSAR